MNVTKILTSLIVIYFFTGCNSDTAFKEKDYKKELTSNRWYEVNSVNEIYRIHQFTNNEYKIYRYASKDFNEVIDVKTFKITNISNDKFDAIYNGKMTTCVYCIGNGRYLSFGCSPNVEKSLNCFGAWNSRSLAISYDF
jgi:hypothetical protein